MAEEAVPVPAEPEKMEVNAEPSTSTEEEKGCEDVDEKAKNLIGAGKKHMVMKDIQSAVCSFQEASSLLGKKYGETADECADAFFFYGVSLLELARMENGVLGNALKGIPDEDDVNSEEEDPKIPSAKNLDEKERDELREQVYGAMAEEEKPNAEEQKTDGKAENGDEHMENDKPSEDKPCEEKTNGETTALNSEKEAEAVSSTVTTEKDTSEAVTEKITEESKESKEPKEEKESEEKTEQPAAKDADSSTVVSEAPSQESEPAKTSEESKPSTEEPESAKPTADKIDTKEQQDAKAEEDEPMEGEEAGDAESDAESEDGEENPETENTENKDEDEAGEEDVGNLQLAWEMLDLCKLIFKRQHNKESQLKAAHAHCKLGEVSIENENYCQAIEDFHACLNIQKEHLDQHDRCLAETHYQLSLAYQYSGKHDCAISHFNQSIEVIEKRVALHKEKLEKAEGESTEELKKEIEELEGLLPDIREKIEDSKEAQKTTQATAEALRETLVGGSSSFAQENGSKSAQSSSVEKCGDGTVPAKTSASDISYLVRKKKRPEEESPVKDAKKSKAEPVQSPLKDAKCNSEPVESPLKDAKKSKAEQVESPLKDAKKSNGEPMQNGSENGDAVVPSNDVVEKAEEEKEAAMDTTVGETTVEKQTPIEASVVETSA